jgi:hypothetical protein
MVACPHRLISLYGVNQRTRCWPGAAGTTNAVVGRPIRRAASCITATAGKAALGTTAAGLPANLASANVSTM